MEITIISKPQQSIGWNYMVINYPFDKAIHQLFEEQVEKTPDAIAIVFENQSLSYATLNQKANQLAHYLQILGVKPEVLVGICVERSLEMVIGLLGILKAGGAYVPLDPDYPAARLVFMLEDAKVPVLLTQSSLKENLPPSQASMVCLDTDWAMISRLSEKNIDSGVKSENLAYVIYTSGSTGKPKGVMITHGSLVNFVAVAIAEYELTPHDRILQFASISFDASAEEIYPCLLCGGNLVLRSNEMLNSVPIFLKNCQALELTVLDLPTAFWHKVTYELAKGKIRLPESLRLVIIGGEEALSASVALWQKWVGTTTPRLVNTYGPTEATVVTTMYTLPNLAENQLQNIPIGRAIYNVQTYVLDKDLQPVPPGVQGELHIGGAALARGYLNHPELTAEKFIPNTFSNDPDARLYKTGDLVRSFPDGNLEFMGRVDHQVKIRGFRVELGEIEVALTQHPDVQESVVVPQKDKFGNLRLVASIVSNIMPERIPFQSVCLIDVDGKRVIVRTENISRGGVHLVGVTEIFTKNKHIHLNIQLLSEHEKRWLNGTVMWVSGSEAGIQFQLTQTEQDLLNQSLELSQQSFVKILERLMTKSLYNYLKNKLPDYMLPHRFRLLNALPMTPNGKIDRRALIENSSVIKYQIPSKDISGEPRTPEEVLLVQIWADLLGFSQISIHDDFFELGGHSLLLSQLSSRIYEAFSFVLPLHCLFESPTVAEIAQVIKQIHQAGGDVAAATTSVIDFNSEAVLDPTIQPPAIPVDSGYLTHPKTILLTGATGFLGTYLLYELLQQTTANVYCLIRSSNAGVGKNKLQRKLESCSLWDDSFNARIIPVIGNLSQPFLGLSKSYFQHLASKIDVIYHNGAMVNSLYPYSQLKATNVLATQEVLKLASKIKTKSVHFISSLSVFSESSGVRRLVRESEIDDIEELEDGYAQSKWVAEKLVMQARDRGLPVSVYRPSRIMGHSQSGVSNLNDLLNLGIKGSIQLGILPPIDDIECNLVPRDYVSSAIIHLSRQSKLLGKTFHLANPNSSRCGDIVNWIRSLGYPIERMSYAQWHAELSSQKQNALYPLLPVFSQDSSEQQSFIEAQFDCQNTIKGLAGTEIVCPPINSKLFALYFSYFWNSGFLEAP